MVAVRGGVRHGRRVSPPPKKRRVGVLALLVLVVALVAAYLGNCFQGLGLGAGDGSGAREVEKLADAATKTLGAATGAAARVRIVVEGERCRLADEKTARACDAVCRDIAGATEVEATAGAQHTVDALRTCLKERGVKFQVLSE